MIKLIRFILALVAILFTVVAYLVTLVLVGKNMVNQYDKVIIPLGKTMVGER